MKRSRGVSVLSIFLGLVAMGAIPGAALVFLTPPSERVSSATGVLCLVYGALALCSSVALWRGSIQAPRLFAYGALSVLALVAHYHLTLFLSPLWISLATLTLLGGLLLLGYRYVQRNSATGQ
jgi:peptidoglycan/LPS O-acetylase OafA/YrhL